MSARRRRELTALWLERLSQSPTPERVEALAPYIDLFLLDRRARRLADELVAHNVVPTRRAVERLWAEKTAGWPAPLSDEELQALGPSAAEWVRQYRATHREGPTWRELGEAFNWHNVARDAQVPAPGRRRLAGHRAQPRVSATGHRCRTAALPRHRRAPPGTRTRPGRPHPRPPCVQNKIRHEHNTACPHPYAVDHSGLIDGPHHRGGPAPPAVRGARIVRRTGPASL